MFKLIMFLIYFLYILPTYAQNNCYASCGEALPYVVNDYTQDSDYGFSISSISSNDSIDILASGGYSMLYMNGDYYSGYNAFLKLFFPLGHGFYLGIGTRYEDLTSNAPSSSSNTAANAQQNSFVYQSSQAGVDLAYKISFSFFDFQINPYAYYAFDTIWTRSTILNNITISSVAPVLSNYVFGVGGSLLFKLSRFYIGPSAYYSWGYISNDSYSDNQGNTYKSNTGLYIYYNFNLTLGVYL
ncbi:hypothetical protein [Silvanigrella aquatica]|uniref:Outer membrane protein beta-barrel domain-containing protein n=1 Tax=Silvanigrella aquatica TaxID=1915309 RepID=A0A1L4CZC4_9BACT|nr:hypothetical protein [Silvanigrella aquatica]APJ03285.1 hypothetical protein AXG55_04960 [Silvanigrella aquatica]